MFSVQPDQLLRTAEDMQSCMKVLQQTETMLSSIQKELAKMTEYEGVIARLSEKEEAVRELWQKYGGYIQTAERIAECYRKCEERILDRAEFSQIVFPMETISKTDLRNMKNMINDLL